MQRPVHRPKSKQSVLKKSKKDIITTHVHMIDSGRTMAIIRLVDWLLWLSRIGLFGGEVVHSCQDDRDILLSSWRTLCASIR